MFCNKLFFSILHARDARYDIVCLFTQIVGLSKFFWINFSSKYATHLLLIIKKSLFNLNDLQRYIFFYYDFFCEFHFCIKRYKYTNIFSKKDTNIQFLSIDDYFFQNIVNSENTSIA